MDWCHKPQCIAAVEEIKIIRKGTVYSKGTFYSKVSAKDQIIDDFSSADGLSQFKRISNDSQRNDYDNYDNDKLIYSVES